MYQRLRKLFRLIRFAIRVCLIVRKYALDSKRDIKEQIFDSNEILFDLSNFRRPVEVNGNKRLLFNFVQSQLLGNNWKKYSKDFEIRSRNKNRGRYSNSCSWIGSICFIVYRYLDHLKYPFHCLFFYRISSSTTICISSYCYLRRIRKRPCNSSRRTSCRKILFNSRWYQ